jgi:HEPN domain-containing protein
MRRTRLKWRYIADIDLTSRTLEQEALIAAYREKWRRVTLSTEPIDRKKAAEGVKAAYEVIGEQEPINQL